MDTKPPTEKSLFHVNCVCAKAHKENCYPIPGEEGGREDNEKSPVEVPLKLRTNWRGIRREGVKVGKKVSLCKENHASEVVRRLAR